MVVPFCITTRNVEFHFFHIPPVLGVVSIFSICCFNRHIIILGVFLICISVMTNEIEHLFTGIFAICISSLVMCLYRHFFLLFLFLFFKFIVKLANIQCIQCALGFGGRFPWFIACIQHPVLLPASEKQNLTSKLSWGNRSKIFHWCFNFSKGIEDRFGKGIVRFIFPKRWYVWHIFKYCGRYPACIALIPDS